jgi:hypothetical protein
MGTQIAGKFPIHYRHTIRLERFVYSERPFVYPKDFGDTVAKYFPVGQYEGEFARFYASVNIESSASPLIPSANLADVVFGTPRIVPEIDFVALAIGAAQHVGHRESY